jgi:hypothetical protein
MNIQDPGPKVGIIARVVPDSYRASVAGNGQMVYRLSLSLLPNPLDNPRGPQFLLANWPSEVMECARKIAIYGRITLDKLTNPVVCDDQSATCRITLTDQDRDRAKAATTLWQRIFAPDGISQSDGFNALWAAIKESLTQTVDKSVPPADYVLSYSPARLAAQLEDLHLGFATAEMLAHDRALKGKGVRSPRPFGRYASAHFWNEVRSAWFNVRSLRPSNRLKEAIYRFPLTRPEKSMPKGGPDTKALALLEQIGRSGGSSHLNLSDRFSNALRKLVAAKREANLALFGKAREGQKALIAQARAGKTQVSWHRPPHLSGNHTLRDDGYFASMAGDTEFWTGTRTRTPAQAAAESTQSDLFMSELAGFAIGHIVSRPPAKTAASAVTCSADQLKDLANSKFMGIQSLPSLAKYLSLTFDLEFDEAQLTDVLHRAGDPNITLIGLLAADILGPNGQAPKLDPEYWTAYAWRSQATFLPATRQQAGGDAAQVLSQEPHVDGLLDLTATLENKQLRYQLLNLDASTATAGLTTALHALAAQTFSPAAAATDFTLPQVRTRGLALLDLDAPQRTVKMLGAMAGHLDTGAGSTKFLHSEDLVVGFRPDVALALKDNIEHPGKIAGRFRSLTRRLVQTGEFKPDEPWVSPYLERDDGLVRVPTKIDHQDITIPPIPPVTLIPHATIATWTGESIAVRPRAPREGDVPLDAVCDLALAFKHDTPGASAKATDRLPPLRFGRRYWFGARLVYINGSSIPFAKAIEQYEQGNILGEQDGSAFLFRRYEPVGAPDVLVPLSDPIVQLDDPTKRPGEHVMQLVVRTAERGLSNNEMHRYIVPIRSTFDVGELHGLFDQDRHAEPEGAFTYLDRMADGSFPVLWDPISANRETVRATLLRMGNTSVPKTGAYYPDPWARACTLAFAQGSNEAEHYASPVSTEFWKKGHIPSDALPIQITLKSAKRRDPAALGTLRLQHTMLPEASALRINEAVVELAPAETVDLWIWCNPDADLLTTQHWMVSRAIALAAKEGKDAEQSIRTMMLGSDSTPSSMPMPIPSIAQPRVLTLVHAVDRPLQNPTFELWAQGPPADIVFNAVAIGVPSYDAWNHYTADHGNEDLRLWSSEEAASTFFFVGRVNIDRTSTSDLRCLARWLEFDEGSSFPRDRRTRQYSFHARPETKELFHVGAISADVKTYGDSLDLMLDETESHALRMLTYKFPTTRARRVQLRLIATSRFTSFFPTNAHRDKDDLGVYETHSSPMSRSPYQFWIQNTVRPDTPATDFWSPPIYGFDESWSADQRKYTATSSAVEYCIWHPAGFYSSGEDTMMGVGFLTEEDSRTYAHAKPGPNEIMEQVLGPLENYVTRWGTDPYVVSGGLEDNIGVDRFAKYDSVQRAVPVLLPASGGGTIESLIDVAAYRPQFDADRGKWRFDVAIDPGDAYFPWVRLKLMRFQQHSILGCQVSLPQDKWVRVPPNRRVQVEFVEARTLSLEVTGIAYLQAGGDPKLTADQQARANAPSLWVLVQEAVAERDVQVEHHQIKWKPCLDQNGQKMLLELRPEAKGKEVRWVAQFQLPDRGEPTRFGLHLQETQYMAADGDTDDEVRLEDAFKTMKFDIDLLVR